MLRADAFFDARPIAIAVWMQPDSIQRRPRGLFGIRAQARTPPSSPVSYKIPAVLCGNPQMLLLEEKDREAANIVKLKDNLMSHFRSNFQSKHHSLYFRFPRHISKNNTFISTCISGQPRHECDTAERPVQMVPHVAYFCMLYWISLKMWIKRLNCTKYDGVNFFALSNFYFCLHGFVFIFSY